MNSIKGKFPVTDKKDTRSGFGAAMTALGAQNPAVVALCADLTGSLKLSDFEKQFPDRFVQCGIAEANMIGMAAGLATAGYIPFATTFANFATGRVYDQIRQSVAYSDKNVKICASHAGLTLGEDGATHQILEDLGLMRMLPGMTVMNTADYNQTYAATIALASHHGPAYLRFGRPVLPVFIGADRPFIIGKADVLHTGADVSLICTGHLVWECILAAEQLEDMGISAEIVNIHTIKPLDTDALAATLSKTRCAVVAEEHQLNGGLGDAVAQWTARRMPLPLEYIGVNDSFGESGTPDQLMEKYGLKARHVVEAAQKALQRKQA
jgi:transketolase